MKIIAFYLPQFHSILENDIWKEKGYTEWTILKRANSLFENHNQPRQPINDNYYNLLDKNTLRWQIDLARKYGIYGFCVYHYWFNGHLLLHRPMEQYLANKDLDFPFCFCWANEDWLNFNIDTGETDILITQTYGQRADWEKHFEYLYSFFEDTRYIKLNGKPLFVLYRPELIKDMGSMLKLWNELAMQKGFPGIAFASQQSNYNIYTDINGELFDYQVEYQPAFIKNALRDYIVLRNGIRCIDYDCVWNEIIKYKPQGSKSIPGAVVDWDNTPRKGKYGTVFVGASPKKFQEYLSIQTIRALKEYRKDIIFLFSWNEWTEGGYLEPDKKAGFGYLEAIQNVLRDISDFK